MMASFLLIGAAAGIFPGLMAFIITYNEYVHHYTEKSKPLRSAVEAGAFAFLVFFVLAILVGFVLTRAYTSQ